jgi:hypothetical protein
MIGKCEKCGKRAEFEIHHKFSQTQLHKRLYGYLIHNPSNLQKLCYDCHHNKPLDKFTELEFCAIFNIIPRSKTGFEIWKRKQHEGNNNEKSRTTEKTEK